MEASLIQRLAGPSTGKAGLAKDQTEINRIIAESSKGSKFFENEKRKDKLLTERIARLLRHRDDVMRNVDVARVEAGVDKTILELEAHRDLSQYIVHVDMDAFFAAVELLDNPSLKGKPFAVGEGVLTTASYEARLYGEAGIVKLTELRGFIAKKLCPQLVLVPIRGERYSEMSRLVMDVFRRYDPDMMAAGIDEGYLNITPYCEAHGMSPENCVQKLRSEVHAETKLTVSAGIAPNKMLAKICSDKNKPNGQFFLPFESEGIIAFMKQLPIRKIPGIGRVSERLLDSIGIKTCGDVYRFRATLALLDKQFCLRSFLMIYLGIGSNVVEPGQRETRKSVGSERTFKPLSDKCAIIAKLENIAADLEEDMERTGWMGRTVTLKYKLATYEVFTRAKSCMRYINRKEDLFSIGKELLLPELPLTLRLIGLRVTKLKDLRAPDNLGLRRFFESSGGSPAKKRRKLDHEDTDMTDPEPEGEVDDTIIKVEDHRYHKTTRDAFSAVDGSDMTVETCIPPDEPPSRRLNPLCDVNHCSANPTSSVNLATKTAGAQTSETGPSRKSDAPADQFASLEAITCPICAKVFDTDNTGLNAHLDYCLSRGAIMEASALRSTTDRSPVKEQGSRVRREN